MKATKIIKMVTSLAPWNKDWVQYHYYKDGEGRQSFLQACSEPPGLLKQEVAFLMSNFPNSPRIKLINKMLDLIFNHNVREDKEIKSQLKILEWRVWWYEAEEFRRVNDIYGGKGAPPPDEDDEPTLLELSVKYVEDKLKSVRYIPIDLMIAWYESKIVLVNG